MDYKLTLNRNSDNAVFNKANATNIAKIKTKSIDWYLPHYTPSFAQEKILMTQIVNKKPTELRYVEWSIFMKEVNTQNLWTFELGTQEGINFPIWIIVGFQQSDRQRDQNLNNDTFYRPPVISAQCIIGNEKYPDSAILLNYNSDDYSQACSQIKEAFRALQKTIYSNHIYLITILDQLMKVIILVIIYTFSILDIRKILNQLN